VSVTPRLAIGRLRDVLERGLIAQSAAERLVKALFAAGLLWLAIWWALS
jgi:hypothetical protein